MILPFQVFAQEDGLTLVAVGEASLEQEKIVINMPGLPLDLSFPEREKAMELIELIGNDFSFYRKFFSVERAYQNKKSYKWSELKKAKITYAMSFVIERVGNSSLTQSMRVKTTLYSVDINKKLKESSLIVKSNSFRKDGHSLANSLYRAITDKDSIFESKIIFVSDKNSRPGQYIKELYIMDFDGRNLQQLTRHRATVVSPAISYDKSKVIYTLISNRAGKRKTSDLYLMDLRTKRSRLISSFPGINSGAIFLPGDKKILLTLSKSGNAEIYEMTLSNKKLRKITHHWAEDVDPSITVDGTLMAFLSSRSRKAEIFTADPRAREKSVKRISYVGKFNATPRFSPDGREIVFSSWLDQRFDLFRISAKGTGLVRLTKNFGSNEDPTYSNDGEFIAFTSQRVLSRKKAIQNVYIMDRDGEILGQVTQNMGNCIGARWSK
jgi:TolB protein